MLLRMFLCTFKNLLLEKQLVLHLFQIYWGKHCVHVHMCTWFHGSPSYKRIGGLPYTHITSLVTEHNERYHRNSWRASTAQDGSYHSTRWKLLQHKMEIVTAQDGSYHNTRHEASQGGGAHPWTEGLTKYRQQCTLWSSKFLLFRPDSSLK